MEGQAVGLLLGKDEAIPGVCDVPEGEALALVARCCNEALRRQFCTIFGLALALTEAACLLPYPPPPAFPLMRRMSQEEVEVARMERKPVVGERRGLSPDSLRQAAQFFVAQWERTVPASLRVHPLSLGFNCMANLEACISLYFPGGAGDEQNILLQAMQWCLSVVELAYATPYLNGSLDGGRTASLAWLVAVVRWSEKDERGAAVDHVGHRHFARLLAGKYADYATGKGITR